MSAWVGLQGGGAADRLPFCQSASHGMSDLGLYMPQPRIRLREAHKGGPEGCLPNRSCMVPLVESFRCYRKVFQGCEICKHIRQGSQSLSHDLSTRSKKP